MRPSGRAAVESAVVQPLAEHEVHDALKSCRVRAEVAAERQEHPVHADVRLLHRVRGVEASVAALVPLDRRRDLAHADRVIAHDRHVAQFQQRVVRAGPLRLVEPATPPRLDVRCRITPASPSDAMRRCNSGRSSPTRSRYVWNWTGTSTWPLTSPPSSQANVSSARRSRTATILPAYDPATTNDRQHTNQRINDARH